MIEFLLASFIIPVGKKLGDRLINRIADGVDDTLADLLHRAVHDQRAEQDVLDYVRAHGDQAEQLESNVTALLQEDAVVAAVGSVIVPARGALLPYFRSVLDSIAQKCVTSDQDIAVEGFLDSDLAVAYFRLELSRRLRGRDPDPDWLEYVEPRKVLQVALTGGVEIHVEHLDSADARGARASALNELIADSDYGSADLRELRGAEKVKEISDRFVQYQRGRHRIPATFEGIQLMQESVAELSGSRSEVLTRLRTITEDTEL